VKVSLGNGLCRGMIRDDTLSVRIEILTRDGLESFSCRSVNSPIVFTDSPNQHRDSVFGSRSDQCQCFRRSPAYVRDVVLQPCNQRKHNGLRRRDPP